jgi:flavin reductase (DIM6/NTAB) family NADH-FMN oxidoreductase RutF
LRIGFAFVGSTSPTCAATFAHHAHRRREASMVEQRELRSVFGNFASGVTVITCRNADGDPHGATVTAFTWVSMEPRLCQVTVTRKSKACKYLSAAPFDRSAFHSLGASSAQLTWAGCADDPEIGWFGSTPCFTPVHIHQIV